MEIRKDVTFQELKIINELLAIVENNSKIITRLQNEAEDTLIVLNKYNSNFLWFIYSCFGGYKGEHTKITYNLKKQDTFIRDSSIIMGILKNKYGIE